MRKELKFYLRARRNGTRTHSQQHVLNSGNKAAETIPGVEDSWTSRQQFAALSSRLRNTCMCDLAASTLALRGNIPDGCVHARLEPVPVEEGAVRAAAVI